MGRMEQIDRVHSCGTPGFGTALVFLGDHHQNQAERPIQTWKAHFISILSGTGPGFPNDKKGTYDF